MTLQQLIRIDNGITRCFTVSPYRDDTWTYAQRGHRYLNNKTVMDVATGQHLAFLNGCMTTTVNFYNSLKGYTIRHQEFLPPVMQIGLSETWGVSTADFLNSSVPSTEKSDDNLLPIAMRYVTGKGLHCFERPPVQVECYFNDRGKNNLAPVKVWAPWTIMVADAKCSEHSIRIYMGPNSLSSTDQRYIPSMFPNMYDDGRPCFSGSLNDARMGTSETNVRFLFSSAYAEYFKGGWNTDLTPLLIYFSSSARVANAAEKYPMIHKFYNFTQDDLLQFYPELKKKKIIKYDQFADSNYDSRKDLIRQYLYTLSTFSLEETLQFYDELIRSSSQKESGRYSSHYSRSFAEIVGLQKIANDDDDDYEESDPVSPTYNPYLYLNNLMVNHFYQNKITFRHSGLMRHAKIVIDHPQPTDPALARVANLFAGYGNLFEALNHQDPVMLTSLLSDLSNRSGDDNVYVFNLADNTWRHTTVPSATTYFFKWYVDYVKLNRCDPYVESTISTTEA